MSPKIEWRDRVVEIQVRKTQRQREASKFHNEGNGDFVFLRFKNRQPRNLLRFLALMIHPADHGTSDNITWIGDQALKPQAPVGGVLPEEIVGFPGFFLNMGRKFEVVLKYSF